MKQDHNDKTDSQENSSQAKSAMASYYDDLLGHMENDPLRKLNAQEMAPKSQSEDLPIRSSAAAPNAQAKKKSSPAAQTEFAERKSSPLMNSVVIPAAFPKFAPPEPDEKKEQIEELKSDIKPQTEALISPPKPRVEKFEKESFDESQLEEALATYLADEEKFEEDIVEEEGVEAKSNEESAQEVQQEVEDLSERASDEQGFVEQTIVEEPDEWLSNGRPVWAQDRFECLLFSVAGLKLAVPLISLGAIYQIEKEFTPLVGRADWFMGLYRTQDRNIQVVDTAKWVMPDRYHENVREGYQFVIRLGGNNWGMACDSVHESIQLDPSQVKWRSERSKRPWLSGTVIDHMCALLDADMLGYLLQKDAKLH